MSLSGLQNYPYPLTLNGFTTIKEDLNTDNIYINGTLTGAGYSDDILPTNNVWDGENDFTNTTTYTGAVVAGDLDLLNKTDIDNGFLNYNPLILDNTWTAVPDFVFNCFIPDAPTSDTSLVSYSSLQTLITENPNNGILVENNVFTGTDSFTNDFACETVILPVNLNDATIKAYVDGAIEVAGNTLTYTLNAPNTIYNFSNINRANIAKIDYILFGGSCDGNSGSIVTGCIGNACGDFQNAKLTIGNINNPATVYTDSSETAGGTTLEVADDVIAGAGGACNLNGVQISGIPYPPPTGLNGQPFYQNGFSYLGNTAGDNLFTNGNGLGTATSGGSAIFIAHYI